ncbi:hypothetical protein RHRU231_40069 [Rhodococcus ruber]|uniref:Uncharacterized protein n=1 Tax=Rhodococcus ruber TaxID=1830 RepID=A0A098BHW8_9NOCA|nr:hypothetical protein RHRU231_40069 [Rhodococcus ruber]
MDNPATYPLGYVKYPMGYPSEPRSPRPEAQP